MPGTVAECSDQPECDSEQSSYYKNVIAQSYYFGSRLNAVCSLERDRESAVTSVLMRRSELRSADLAPDLLSGLLDRWLAARESHLVAVRRHIHAHPELSHHEFETAALVARELSAAGLSPQMLPRGNGVICDIGTGDRVIALRADMDALPLQDCKDVPYRSTRAGAAHACGHDVHTTVLLGAGLVLAQLDQQGALEGRVRLIFQPAEESVASGAPEMITAGALKDVAAIFALHVAPHFPLGTIATRSGAITAACDMVEVQMNGRGGHTARPHLTVDLINALGRMVTDVPSMLGRRVDARAGMSMAWGSIHAGEASNAIPSVGTAKGTVRMLSREAWLDAPELVEQLIRDVTAGTGADVDVRYQRVVPPVINDRRAVSVISTAANAALGPDSVVECEVSMGGEDFAFYLEHVPGAMIRLGTASPTTDCTKDIHEAEFDVDERCIPVGVRMMAHIAYSALRSQLMQ